MLDCDWSSDVCSSDLAKIAAGGFLRDLLYRIDVISIHLPPLRERAEDIPLLVEHFTARYARRYLKNVVGVAPETMRALLEYPWPGNIRELKNCLARAVILSKGVYVTPESLPQKITRQAPPEPSGQPGLAPPAERAEGPAGAGLTLKDMETELIITTLKRCQGNKTLAARMLGISRKGLYEKMDRLGIGEGIEQGGKAP
jgi:DNA-binding NtrC family response regulator